MVEKQSELASVSEKLCNEASLILGNKNKMLRSYKWFLFHKNTRYFFWKHSAK
jgi:hypothetical protein